MTRPSSTRLELAADFANVGAARRFLRIELAGCDPVLVEDLQLAVSELVTNAIEHGRDVPVLIEVDLDADRVVVAVTSHGPAPGVGPVVDWVSADPDEISGRGLAIVRTLADAVGVERAGPDAFRISLTRRIVAA